MMKWLKAAVIGALAGLVMFIIINFGIRSGVAPFGLPPSAAFLESIGIQPMPLGPIVHFVYAIFWSIVLVAIFQQRTNITKGLGLALILWLIMMVIYSPIIGWGIFGANLGNPGMYVIATLVLHAIYGLIVGWLDPLWINFSQEPEQMT